MKKLKSLLIISALLVSIPTATNAMQTKAVKEQQAVNKNSAQQMQEMTDKNELFTVDQKIDILSKKYLNNFRTCEPLHITESLDFFGLKISIQVDINGWVNNKCSYYMTGNIGGLGKDIREVFNINQSVTDEQIEKFKPVIECNFSKAELNTMIDAFIARNERNTIQIAQMLEKPNKKYINTVIKNISNQKQNSSLKDYKGLTRIIRTVTKKVAEETEEVLNEAQNKKRGKSL